VNILAARIVLLALALGFMGMFTANVMAANDAGPVTHVALSSPDGVVQPGIGTSPAIADPTTDPGGTAKEIAGAFAAGMYAFGVILVLLAISRLYLWACAKWDLGKWEVAAPYVVTGSGVLAAIAASTAATGGIDWRAVLGAILAAVALYLTPAPKGAR
jgi:hypothetical protein